MKADERPEKAARTKSAYAYESVIERLPPRPGPVQFRLQSLAFLRHIPASKIASRLKLTLRRKLYRSGPKSLASDCSLKEGAPGPLFPPRAASVKKHSEGWYFCVLNKTVNAASLESWRLCEADAQLEAMTLNYMEYLEAAPDDLLVELVESWIAYGFSGIDHYWRDVWNSYSASLRAIVWMQQATRPGLDSIFRDKMASAAAAHIIFIEDNLEQDLGGNHLVKNLKALLWASAAFEGAPVVRWREKGMALLAQALKEQILPEGMHAERSASYHAQVFADLLEIRHALGVDPLDGALDCALARMAQVVADLVHPDGLPVQFNDSGLTMAYSPAQCLQAYAKTMQKDPPAAQPVFDLPLAGYSGARAGSDALFCDFGCIGPNDLPGHGHSDIGSFEWSVGGRRIIVDQGVYEYIDGERRRISKAAAAHNTLSIAGYDQADFFGAFRCGRRPSIIERKFELRPEGFLLEGRHDGWSRAPHSPVHFRRFVYENGDLEIEDRLDRQAQNVTTGFLLHPAVEAQVTPSGFSLASGSVRIEAQSRWPANIENAVWWPDLGHELRTTRIVLQATADSRENNIRFTVIAR